MIGINAIMKDLSQCHGKSMFKEMDLQINGSFLDFIPWRIHINLREQSLLIGAEGAEESRGGEKF